MECALTVSTFELTLTGVRGGSVDERRFGADRWRRLRCAGWCRCMVDDAVDFGGGGQKQRRRSVSVGVDGRRRHETWRWAVTDGWRRRWWTGRSASRRLEVQSVVALCRRRVQHRQRWLTLVDVAPHPHLVVDVFVLRQCVAVSKRRRRQRVEDFLQRRAVELGRCDVRLIELDRRRLRRPVAVLVVSFRRRLDSFRTNLHQVAVACHAIFRLRWCLAVHRSDVAALRNVISHWFRHFLVVPTLLKTWTCV